MSWFFDAAPYILAFGAIALGALEILKDWNEYKIKWQRMTVAVVFVIVAVVTIPSLRHDNAEKAQAASKAEGDMRELQGKVDAANTAQQANTALYLDSISKMSKEVSELKAEVKTEALQKKLTSVQADLQNTQKALAPGPKADLTFTFVPYEYPSDGKAFHAVRDAFRPVTADGIVHIDFTVINLTQVDAANVEINFRICKACTYASEPRDFRQLPGTDEKMRDLVVAHLQPMQVLNTLTVDIRVPSNVQNFEVGLGYRCTTCVLPKEFTRGTVHILGR